MYHFFRGLVPRFYQNRYFEAANKKNKKPKFYMENLPLDVIVGILRCSSNFADLNALITASAVCYRLFKRYQNSILVQVARNIIGPDEDAWRIATTILVYQRKDNFNSTKYLPDFASMEFVLQRGDISHLISNVKFFEAVAKKFAKYVNSHFPLVKAPKGMDAPLSVVHTSFAAGDTLSMKFFFQQWLFSLQLGYDTIETFATRKPLTKQQLMDVRILMVVIRRTPGYKRFSVKTLWNRKNSWLNDVTAKRISTHRNWCWPFCKANYMLWVKIMYHYDYIIWKDGWNGIRLSQYDTLMVDFCSDLEVTELGPLIEKYGLSCGWDQDVLGA